MPFTPAHAAAILPLRSTPLPLAALAIGSMAPDTPLFAPWLTGYRRTHSGVGIVTVDVVIALVVLALWTWVVRDTLVELAPAAVRERLDPHARLTRRQWVLAVPAVAIGAATHVLWDAFTHTGRWGPDHVAWLREEHWGRPGTSWAQYASGIAGLVVVALVATAWLRARPRTPRPAALFPRAVLPALIAVLAVAGVVVLVVRNSSGSERAAYDAVVATIRLGLAVVAVLCVRRAVARPAHPA